MSPEGRAWAERKIALWSKRAAELRARPEERGALQRAHGLDFIVSGLAARIAEPSEDARVAKLAALRARLESSQPYMHPTYKIMFNKGPLMDDIRAEVAAKIAALEAELGEAAAAPSPAPAPPPPPAPVVAILPASMPMPVPGAAAPMQMALAL